MKPHVLALTLILALSLSLSPALAAEDPPAAEAPSAGEEVPAKEDVSKRLEEQFPEIRAYEGFSDVKDGDWFAPYVELCYETGLLAGTGNEEFSPTRKVTREQSLTLAARIHHILNGGDGNLPEAPGEWGQITLTLEDGTTIACYEWGSEHWWEVVGNAGSRTLEIKTDLSWMHRRERAQVTLEPGVTIPGQIFWVGGKHPLIGFRPDEDTEEFQARLDALAWRCAPGYWFRPTAYYLETAGLTSHPDMVEPRDESGTREEFVTLLSIVAGDLLTPINQIETFPDADSTDPELVLPFYNAGILTGTDVYGTFSPEKSLSRAEMAAMAARLVRPALRVSFTLEEYSCRDYALTPMDTRGGSRVGASTDFLVLGFTDDAGEETGFGILHADNSWVFPQEELTFIELSSRLIEVQKEDPASPHGYATGVMDAYTGEMVLPFGQYRQIILLEDGLFRVIGKRDVLCDRTGAELAQLWDGPNWDAYGGGLAPCRDGETGLWGYVNLAGDWIIPPAWTSAKGFQDGMALVSDGTAWGVIDRSGALLLPCQYQFLTYHGEGLFHSSNFLYATDFWLRLDGSTFTNESYAYGLTLSNGYIALEGQYLDGDFIPATPREFDWVGPVGADGSSFVSKDGQIYRLTFTDTSTNN